MLPQGITEPVCRNGTTPDISRRTAEQGLEHWTCGTVRGLGPIQPYNPLAVLMDVPGARLRIHMNLLEFVLRFSVITTYR